ncbi:aldo/keto reductase [Oceanibium sediminis]|uniref:aldo/keto reductase n=1 Tax=Oceanibium sediminis TaxID=2026339 RepID=UPI0013008396|nr:aldo/keto reductase [Oceanibium sediminis]
MTIPKIGLGTAPIVDVDWAGLVATALGLGYTHVDTAQMYDNEAAVGQGLRMSGHPDDVFLTTKIHQDRFRDGTALESAQTSVEKLGRVPDLMLVHWPPRGVETEAVIDTMLEVQAAGLTRSIGVSNFNRPQLRAAAAKAPIATNQVEFHVLIDQSALHEEARALGIPLTAYMPVARGKAFDPPEVGQIAARHGITPAQVVLRWIVQQGVIAIPLSTKVENLKANLAVLDLSLEPEDMDALTAVATRENTRFCSRPDWDPVWDAE